MGRLIEISKRLPPQSWSRVRLRTGLLIAGSVCMSVLTTNWILEAFSYSFNAIGLFVTILMPIILGGPVMFYLTLRQEELEHANRQLAVLATTDWLTDCLNRGAFTRTVADDLANPTADERMGALLIVDADDFKQVNDRFGHKTGDEALKCIAATIRASIRDGDLLGRLGGEEFGVYMPDASPTEIDQLAECIRFGIASLEFSPNGIVCPLSVSIGGTSFFKPADYETLYQLADERLYAAKNGGRDRIVLMRAAA